MAGTFASDPAISIRRAKTGFPGIHLFMLKDALHWAHKQSMWPLGFGQACCAVKMMAASASTRDFSYSSMEFIHLSPRQADLMIISGRVNVKIAAVARRLYDQMANPKWVIAIGNCSYPGDYAAKNTLVQAIHEFIPVDIFVAGCPPRPEALLQGILALHEKNLTIRK